MSKGGARRDERKAIEKDRHRESRTFHNIHNTTFLWIMYKQTVENTEYRLLEGQVKAKQTKDESDEGGDHVHAHGHSNRVATQSVPNPVGSEVHSGKHRRKGEQKEHISSRERKENASNHSGLQSKESTVPTCALSPEGKAGFVRSLRMGTTRWEMFSSQGRWRPNRYFMGSVMTTVIRLQ